MSAIHLIAIAFPLSYRYSKNSDIVTIYFHIFPLISPKTNFSLVQVVYEVNIAEK
jgi:hypothetical protein